VMLYAARPRKAAFNCCGHRPTTRSRPL